VQGVEKQDGFLSVDVVAPGLVGSDTVFGFLAANRAKVFPPQVVDPMFSERARAGQPSVPGPVMLSALVLQALQGVSDRGAAEALAYDLRWKAACGIGVDEWAWHPTTFTVWRNRIAKSAHPGLVFDAVAKIIAESGALTGRRRRVVDSTVVDDAVARQDAFKLLVWQIAKIGEVMPQLAERIDGLPGGVWYRDRVKPDIDWTSRQAKNDLVSVLVNDALTVEQWANDVVDRMADGDDHKAALEDQVGLLGVLAGQDVEPAPGSDGTDGRWRIARRTAPDRVISVVDPQARHIRKTTQNKHDGFKAHMVAEPDTGLVASVGVSSGCGEGSSDTVNAISLLTADSDAVLAGVDEVQGDSAYATTAMLAVLDARGVEAVVKPRPLPTPVPGGYSLDDFMVDTAHDTITCPAGHTTSRDSRGRATFARWCESCPMKPRCTNARKGRVVVIGDTQLRLRRHRQKARGPGFAERLRAHRPMAERSLAWLTRPGRRTPYRGITKTSAWFSLRAAAVNLKRLTNLGLTLHPEQGWMLNPVG